jgi:hypothetical protein
MAKQRRKHPDFDHAQFPLLAITLEESDAREPRGIYDPETDTWSHRDWGDQTPKKHNEER